LLSCLFRLPLAEGFIAGADEAASRPKRYSDSPAASRACLRSVKSSTMAIFP
jgi:hypothetical protein